jgi:hypothetical protein
MPSRKPRARPKKTSEAPIRGEVIPVRVTPEEKAAIERKATLRHRGASTWMRLLALEAPEDPLAQS